MSWAVKYRGEFYDLKGLDWRIDIEEDGYSGSVNTMQLGSPALTIEHLAASDDLLAAPIKGTMVSFNIISTSHFQYTSLYSSEDLKYRVSIYYGTTHLYLRGYLSTDYQEPYEDIPYQVTVAAADGLGLLKDIPYDDNGTAYQGRRHESRIVLDILGKIGFTEFKEACNVYESRMAADVEDSPFDQTLIDVDLFDGMYCYQVLEEILKKYNAVIRQVRGEFWIYRPKEFTTTVNYRHFTAYDTKTYGSFTPDQTISRPTEVTNIEDYPGGVLMLNPPVKKFTAEQDYGYKESWIDNHNFDPDTFDLDSGMFDGWIKIGGRGLSPLPVAMSGEVNGVLMTPEATVPDLANYTYQDFGTYAKATNETILFSLDYRLINWTEAVVTDVDVCIIIGDVAGNYWVDLGLDDALCSWETTEHYMNWTVASVPTQSSSWVNFAVSLPGLPVDGPYKIKLFPSHKGIFIAFKNIRFQSTSDQVIINKWQRARLSRNKQGQMNWFLPGNIGFGILFGKHTTWEYIDNDEKVTNDYVVTNPVAGPENSQSYMLGDVADSEIDNVIEQFAGSLALTVVGSLSKTASDFVIANAATYLAGGVILTSNAEDIVFTSSTAGTNFTGSTTITNATGTLTGSVAASRANSAAIAQVATLLLSGTSGSAKIYVGSLPARLATFDTDLNTTSANFVTDFAAAYATANITLTYSGDSLIFTEASAGGGFGEVSIVNFTTNLSGTLPIGSQTDAAAAVARIDTITLSGGSGTANILCDGTTRTSTYNTATVLDYTKAWNTRGGTENKPLISLIADEMAVQHWREKHFLQASLREKSSSAPDINILYNFQDVLNQYAGVTRMFMANRGSLDVYNREWSIDLVELPAVSDTPYYIATTGSDATGDGTLSNPWASLGYACTQVTAGTIYVTAGTYTQTTQVVLPAGVSVRGAGATSIITTGAALNPMIVGTSVADGTDGDQSISYIAFDGDLVALTCMSFTGRSNVKIHHIAIDNFVSGGILLRGAVSGTNPTTFATGNEIYNCEITNSATRGGGGSFSGLISISGQQGLLIHDNILDQTDRAQTDNGNIVNAVGGGSEANSGFNNGLKYYRNKSYKPYSEGTEWNFHIESWDATGWEIYDSEFHGGGCHIDIGGYTNEPGDYAYSFYIHDNLFSQDALQPINASISTVGIDIESSSSYVIVSNNRFVNLQWGVYHSLNLSREQHHIYVQYNLFERIGLTNNLWAAPAILAAEGTAPAYHDIFYDNNTMVAATTFNVAAGLVVVLAAGTATDIYVRNNIISGFYRGPIWIYTGAGQTGTLYQRNNQHYNTSDAIYYSAGETITNLVASDNQTGDPVFVSATDFHLQVTSPCIDQGIDVGLTQDYDGDPVGDPPEIGCFEY